MSGDEKRSIRRPRTIKPPQLPHGAVKDLKRALYELYTAAGQPRLDDIEAAIDDMAAQLEEMGEDLAHLPGIPRRDTVRRIIGDAEVRQSEQDYVSVAVVLADMANRPRQVVADRIRALWRRARNAPTPPRAGRPVRDFDPFDLEVHRAIDSPSADPALPPLPVYVSRAHDQKLAAVIDDVAAGHSRIAILVGGSSTGKTRACWEAVQRLPKEWYLWHPIDPSHPVAVRAALDAVSPYTVVWFNEAQHYLRTPDPEIGEQVAARLRELLRTPNRGPVLVLGTVWPEHLRVLTRSPLPGRLDVFPHARHLLARATVLSVPKAFTDPADLDALRRMAESDPRLAEAAARAESGRITQYLAGTHKLLERYLNAEPTAQAVIHVAMDARRLGHPPAIPRALLASAVPGYLTDDEWYEANEGSQRDWLDQALDYTAEPCNGVRGPLTPHLPRPDQPGPDQPTFRLADYLEQVAPAERDSVFPPTSFWNGLAAVVTNPAVLRVLGLAAQRRGRYNRAAQLYRKAASTGDRRAMAQLAVLQALVGDWSGAQDLAEQAAELGDSIALIRLAELRERDGDLASAERLYRQAADGGNAAAGVRVVELAHRSDSGDSLYDSELFHRAEERERVGDLAGAVTLYRRAAEDGDTAALLHLARVTADAGDLEQAERLALEVADMGDTAALVELGHIRGIRDRSRGGPAVARQLDRSDFYVLMKLAELHEYAGDLEGAVSLYREGANRGHPFALAALAEVMERSGDVGRANLIRRFGLDDDGWPADGMDPL